MERTNTKKEISCENSSDFSLGYFSGTIFPYLYSTTKYTWKMVDFLMALHPGKKFLTDMPVNPTDIEIEIVGWLNYKIPFKFLRYMFNNCILSL